MIESRYEIPADGQHLGVRVFEFANTRLVGGEFACSTTGEGGGKERQNHVLLAAKIRKLHGMIAGVRQREIGRRVADLEMRMLRLLGLLSKKTGGSKRECDEPKAFHSDLGASLAQFLKELRTLTPMTYINSPTAQTHVAGRQASRSEE